MVGKAPGHSVHEGVLYRSPLVLNSGFAVMTPMHGIARGCYDAFVDLTGGRTARPRAARPADRVETQIAVGKSGAEIDLAYLITEKLTATVFRGGKVARADAVAGESAPNCLLHVVVPVVVVSEQRKIFPRPCAEQTGGDSARSLRASKQILVEVPLSVQKCFADEFHKRSLPKAVPPFAVRVRFSFFKPSCSA